MICCGECDDVVRELEGKVARLSSELAAAREEIERWKIASGLERGGDPDGVRPDDVSGVLDWYEKEVERHKQRAAQIALRVGAQKDRAERAEATLDDLLEKANADCGLHVNTDDWCLSCYIIELRETEGE